MDSAGAAHKLSATLHVHGCDPKNLVSPFTGSAIDYQPRNLGLGSSSLIRQACSTYDTQLQFLALRRTSVQPSGARSRK
jgi:hypothetical protein